MIIAIAGGSSRIAKAYISDFCGDHDVLSYRSPVDLPVGADRYLICSGVLHGKNLREISREEAVETVEVNFLDVAKACDIIIEANDYAKICIIGSASGEQGSYDMAYAGAKSAIHTYVKHKRLRTAHQHLVAVAPWIVSDAGMSIRRKDFGQLLQRGERRRMGRWPTSQEVAQVMHFALNTPLMCNTVVEAKGGNW